ncbi:hypothetical protein CSKR_102452 [Clonorchis sinensis]|uniref:Uncharacterized protein n=1 Tax=Clonorchis sinensis TaxID=79923 RepID=A0A419QF40_CLOSI|nr:hypothetical protein CSKR_102452 [Clonorchis sinensis]
MAQWLEREFTDRKVRQSNPTSASRFPLSRLRQPGSIPTLVPPSVGMAVRHQKGCYSWTIFKELISSAYPVAVPGFELRTSDMQVISLRKKGRDGSSGQSANLLTGRSVVRTRPLALDFPCLGLGNLAVSQPSCLHRVAWQFGTERVLQLNDRI